MCRIISFVAFSYNIFFVPQEEVETLSIHTQKLQEYQRSYHIRLNNEEKQKIWTMYESINKDSDMYVYNINLQLSSDDELWMFSNIAWQISFFQSWKIDSFHINVWNIQLRWQLDPHRQEKILINYERYNTKESQLMDIHDFNIDMIFSKLLPFIKRDISDTKLINILDVVSVGSSSKVNYNTIKVTKKSDKKFIAKWELFGSQIQTLYEYDKDGILLRQENPFFVYEKADWEDFLEEPELQINWNWQNWSETEPNWQSDDENVDEEDLQCKIIWIDD